VEACPFPQGGPVAPTKTPSPEPKSEREPDTNPESGVTLTSQELAGVKVGKKNERGDMVYFQPCFIDSDAWAALRNAE
jgi:hypothetical protein